MPKRPNVLWLMTDQHNAGCTGYNNHPDVKTPNLDRIAARGVNFRQGFSNNPICSPSRICFMTGQYMRTHQMYGNDHAEWPTPNPDTLACLFRRYGYQTALVGKSHMVRRWDEDGFEHIRYTDLADATRDDPTTTHYFNYLVERGLADLYEEGAEGPGHINGFDGSAPALLPYEHSIEHYTGQETLNFLKSRDESRPFFLKMSFQRPHGPITPAPEYFDLYDPDSLTLPDSAVDYFENRFAGKPVRQREHGEKGGLYPLADPDEKRLRRCLASYYALIHCIDMEIGRVLDALEKAGELENTVIFYTADHGDFAGEHGLFHKNFGIYESIQRTPFLLSWPGGPQGVVKDDLVESVDWYPTLCSLANVPMPEGREGIDLAPVAAGDAPGKDAAYCEWDWPGGKVVAIRTADWRLVFYENGEGELYDRRSDPGEVHNLWESAEHAPVREELTRRLFRFCLGYKPVTDMARDRRLGQQQRWTPTKLLHKRQRYWSELYDAFEKDNHWPPQTQAAQEAFSRLEPTT